MEKERISIVVEKMADFLKEMVNEQGLNLSELVLKRNDTLGCIGLASRSTGKWETMLIPYLTGNAGVLAYLGNDNLPSRFVKRNFLSQTEMGDFLRAVDPSLVLDGFPIPQVTSLLNLLQTEVEKWELEKV